jgi:HEAT repeat protein
MSTATAIDYLQQRLTLPADEGVIQEILSVLGRIASPDLKQTAATVIHTAIATLDTPTLKQMAALSLGQLSQPQSIEPLVNLLADPDAGVRLHAIAALRQIDAETAYQRLQASTQTDDLPDELRQGIAVALAEW